ncbi:MAG: signal peptide peptidase SppA [Syntrophobacterales bacterium]|jgi:protease-4|nr:signal peptide peptidase SppA [Syntrophobacterales bacterium]
MNKRLLLVALAVFFVSGCAFVNIPLYVTPQPLQEKVLEGEGKTKILLVDVSGFLSETAKDRGSIFREEVPLLSRLKEELQKAEKDRSVGGLIVRINSPGGTVTASDAIHHEITEFKKRTGARVVACINGLGTSGAYYVASSADEIVALPTSVTGSIGVIAMRFDVHDLLGKIGVSTETVKSGEKKDLWSPFRPSTPQETEVMQRIIDQLHGRFIDVVATGRKNMLTRAEIVKLADGRIYTAEQAREAKLVDRIGYLDDALSGIKRSLNIQDARLIVYHRPDTYRGTIYSDADRLPPVVNLLNVNGDSLSLLPEVRFLYLWNP